VRWRMLNLLRHRCAFPEGNFDSPGHAHNGLGLVLPSYDCRMSGTGSAGSGR
jgi:hypothetical protein